MAFFQDLDADTWAFLIFGAAVVGAALTIPWRYWTRRSIKRDSAQRMNVAGRVLSLAVGLMLIGFGSLRGYRLRQAAASCRDLFAHTDIFHRRDILTIEPVPPVPRFGRKPAEESITCSRYAPR
jgi:hypothetical protein